MKIKVTDVVPIDNFNLKVFFSNGFSKVYDVKPLIGELPKIFSVFLEDKDYFNNVKPEEFGNAVVWDDERDIAAEELWYNGELDSNINFLDSNVKVSKLDEDFVDISLSFKFPKKDLNLFGLDRENIALILKDGKISF